MSDNKKQKINMLKEMTVLELEGLVKEVCVASFKLGVNPLPMLRKGLKKRITFNPSEDSYPRVGEIEVWCPCGDEIFVYVWDIPSISLAKKEQCGDFEPSQFLKEGATFDRDNPCQDCSYFCSHGRGQGCWKDVETIPSDGTLTHYRLRNGQDVWE